MTFCYVSEISNPYLPLTNGSGSCSFRQWPFSLKFYTCSFLKVHLHHSSKIKSHKKSKNIKIKGFLHFLLVYGRIRIRVRTNKLRIRMRSSRPKTYGSYGSESGTLKKSEPFFIWSIIDYDLLELKHCGFKNVFSQATRNIVRVVRMCFPCSRTHLNVWEKAKSTPLYTGRRAPSVHSGQLVLHTSW